MSLGPMQGDSTVLNHAFTRTSQYLGELETHLNKIEFVRQGLEGAVQHSKTSDAVQNKLFEAHRTGKDLAGYLQRIADALQQRGAKIDADDLDGSSAMNRGYAAEGANGNLDTSFNSKVDSVSWS